MNENLIRHVTIEEIRTDVFGIGPDRAPGPDGFTEAFYQQFWFEISPSIIAEVQDFFSYGHMKEASNHTNFCLLPK